jgi:hypothetical protein
MMLRYAPCWLTAALLLCGVSPLFAQAPVVSDLFAMRLQNSANSTNRATGEILYWGANTVEPTTSWGFTRQCPTAADCSSGPGDPDFVRQALYFRSMEVVPKQYFASRPYDAQLTNPWRLLLSSDPAFPNNPAKSTFVNTPSVGGVAQMPFVASMTVSGSGLTPTISWELPAALPAGLTVDRVQIRVLEKGQQALSISRSPTFANSFLQDDLVFNSDAMPGTQTSFTLPSSWQTPAGTRSLQYGSQYSIVISLDHNRPGLTTTDSRSQSYFEFSPINLPGVANIQLPTAVPVPTTSGLVAGPLYQFSVGDVSPNSVTFIDPFVATGFTYRTGAGDPNFKSVKIATPAGDGLNDLWRLDGADWVLVKSHLATGETFDFVSDGGIAGGVSAFEVRGIETSAAVSPFDVTAFVTGLTFVSEGRFTGTMQAIATEVASVPEPGTLALWLAGLGMAGALARRRACAAARLIRRGVRPAAAAPAAGVRARRG